MKTTCAHHDLNGVGVIEIAGWTGVLEVEPWAKETGVSLIAPKIHECEFWTFQRLPLGILRCFWSMVGTPSASYGTGAVRVQLPAGRVDAITVRQV
jgi:hypothetical protein